MSLRGFTENEYVVLFQAYLWTKDMRIVSLTGSPGSPCCPSFPSLPGGPGGPGKMSSDGVPGSPGCPGGPGGPGGPWWNKVTNIRRITASVTALITCWTQAADDKMMCPYKGWIINGMWCWWENNVHSPWRSLHHCQSLPVLSPPDENTPVSQLTHHHFASCFFQESFSSRRFIITHS